MLLRAQTGTLVLQGAVTASPEPSAYENSFTLTLNLTTPANGAAPTGSVTFSVDGGAPSPAIGLAGSGTMYSSSYMIGSPTYSIAMHTISALYSGDTNYAQQTYSGTHVVSKLRSDIVLSPQSQALFYGQTVQGNASVGALDPAPDATINGGITSFYINGTDVCDLVVTSQGESCPDSAGQGYAAGTYTFYATYSGNQYYDSSMSQTASVLVLPDDTTTGVLTSLTPSTFGQNVTFTAVVSAPYATPTGPVVFLDGSTPIGTAQLDANGDAQFSLTTLAVGTHSISASYAITQNFNASGSTPITQVVVQPAISVSTATLLNSSANPSTVGQSVTFSAAVSTTGAFTQAPTGSVTFTDGSTNLGTVPLNSSGAALLTTSTLTLGTHTITATYSGGTGFAGSVASLQQVVTSSLISAGTGFLLTVTPTTFQIGVGGYASLSVTVTPLNGFNQPVQLSCNNLPNEAVCTFFEPIIAVGGGTTTLLVNPAAPHACGSTMPYGAASSRSVALSMLGAGALVLFAGKRRKMLKGIVCLGMLAILPMLGGCGSGNCTDLGVKPGNYTFAVQGTAMPGVTVMTSDTPLTQTQTVQMTVHI